MSDKKKKSEELIPIDAIRCQAEIKHGSFMTMGLPSMKQCTNIPTWIAIQTKGTELHGAMSLCDACKKVCETLFTNVNFWKLDNGVG